MEHYIKLLALIVLLLVSAFFSSSEVAFFSLSRVKLRRRQLRQTKNFHYVFSLLKAPSRFLATVLIGNELVNISLSVVAAALVYSLARDLCSHKLLAFISMVLTVPVLLLFGEIIPKTVAVNFPEKIARINAYPLHLFSRMIAPLRFALNGVAQVFITLFVKDPTKHPVDAVNIDEDIFKSMVDSGSKEGTIGPCERDLIHRTFRLDDITVSNIMTPRARILAVPAQISEKEFVTVIEADKYSRYPVYDETIDTIIGFVHVKDLFRLQGMSAGNVPFSIKRIMRTPTYIDVDRNALSVFLQFQKNKTHLGIVVDHNGKTAGLVSLEDILEELVGEIRDETDMEDEHR